MEEKIIKSFKLNNRLKTYLNDNEDTFNDIEKYCISKSRRVITPIQVLILEEYSEWCSECKFILSNDGKSIECFDGGIPSQIIYQKYFNEKSQFLNFTVKELKSVCKCISSKLNDNMDKVILRAYRDYEEIAIKFEIDYLKATSFSGVINYAYAKKSHYINYLDFMNSTGLFEYELNHIKEIFYESEKKNKLDREKIKEREKVIEMQEEIIKYLKNNYYIEINDEDDYDCCKSAYSDCDYYEEIFDDYEYYQEVSEKHPNKYSIYKWCIGRGKNKIFMSNTPLTADMVFVESSIVNSLKNTNLKESIKEVDGYLKTPVEYVMTLDEYVKSGFKNLL